MLLLVNIKSFFSEKNTSCHCHPHYVTEYLESELLPYFFGDLDQLAKTCAKITMENEDRDIKFLLVTKDNIEFLAETSQENLQTNGSVFTYLSNDDDYYDSGQLDKILEAYNKELQILREEKQNKEKAEHERQAKLKAQQDEAKRQNDLKIKQQTLANLAKELGVTVSDPTKT